MRLDLRPIERRVIAMSDDGLGVDEVAQRVRRSPGQVRRILELSGIERSGPAAHRAPAAVEARVRALRERGESDEAIARRFGRSAEYVRRIDRLSAYRASRA